MIKHYIYIALRNISKYKAQTIISVCAMAVSITLIVAMLISFPIGLLINSTGAFEVNGIRHTFGSLLGTFVVALVIIVAITALTIAWKIRQIMRVDPIEYLKE